MWRKLLVGGSALAVVTGSVLAFAQATEEEEAPLPTEMVVIDIDAKQSQSFNIAIVDLFGPRADGTAAAAALRNDFRLLPGYHVVKPDSVRHDVKKAGMGVSLSAWVGLGAKGVVKGQITSMGGDQLRADFRFFHLPRATPVLEQTYRGPRADVQKWSHDFANKILAALTGKPGAFGTKLTFARREGRGRKDVFCSQMDGTHVKRISNGKGIAMLPSFEPSGHVWFTRLTGMGMFITRSEMKGMPVISGNGLNMNPAVCHGRIFFTSSRDGNSEIYSAGMDGRNVKRLTNHPAIDASPSCGPNNQLAFVSARHGSPQIFVMKADGSGQKRVTFRGNHNQTPAWCPDPQRNLIAFTGRDGSLDVFTVDIDSQEYTRLTQGQGMNKDPSFSPDCRFVVFASDRRGAEGAYLSSPKGFGQTRVLEGAVETLRWQHEVK